MSEEEIHLTCGKYNIQNYSINPDGSIDVDGNVILVKKNLKEIPLKFNIVYGFFDISSNRLTSLKGCPKVSSFIAVYYNPLETLEGLIVPYNYLFCDNKEKLIRKHKLNIINIL